MRSFMLAAWSSPMFLNGLRDGVFLGLGIGAGAGLAALVIHAIG